MVILAPMNTFPCSDLKSEAGFEISVQFYVRTQSPGGRNTSVAKVDPRARRLRRQPLRYGGWESTLTPKFGSQPNKFRPTQPELI